MSDDAALLRRFVDERTEADFAELVRRHIDMVYTVALRRTAGHVDAALELSQETFSRLATSAAHVSRRALVAGWLHATVQRLPVKPEESAGNPPEEEGPAQIDGALAHLAEDDRSALLLHYFERRSLAEVGVALNLSAEAAGLCIRRAVEKLRTQLALRGPRLGTAALLALLDNLALTSAPAGAADRIATEAVNAAELNEIGGEKGTFFAGLIGLINSGLALGVAAGVAIAVALWWGYRTNSRLEGELMRLHGDAQVLADRQRDNRRLARLIDDVERLRRDVVDLPAVRAVARPNGPGPEVGAISLTVTPAGLLRWETEEVSAEEFLQRLRAFRTRYPSPDTSVFIRGAGAAMSAVMYVVNESRKAGIRQVLVDGNPRPDNPGQWF